MDFIMWQGAWTLLWLHFKVARDLQNAGDQRAAAAGTRQIPQPFSAESNENRVTFDPGGRRDREIMLIPIECEQGGCGNPRNGFQGLWNDADVVLFPGMAKVPPCRKANGMT
jgi:hypothetical protein